MWRFRALTAAATSLELGTSPLSVLLGGDRCCALASPRHMALCRKEVGEASPMGDALWAAQMFIGCDSCPRVCDFINVCFIDMETEVQSCQGAAQRHRHTAGKGTVQESKTG